VGVTTRASSATKLRELDADRYADLDLRVNDLGWDVLRHVGALLKAPDDVRLLPDLEVTWIYLAGFSQSGIDTATFAGAIDGVARLEDGDPVYDGYLPAAHSGSLAPLRSGDAVLPRFVSEPLGPVDVPVVDLETQSDVEGFEAEIDATRTYTNPGHAGVRRRDADRDGDRTGSTRSRARRTHRPSPAATAAGRRSRSTPSCALRWRASTAGPSWARRRRRPLPSSSPTGAWCRPPPSTSTATPGAASAHRS
jgi:hypothetical protein